MSRRTKWKQYLEEVLADTQKSGGPRSFAQFSHDSRAIADQLAAKLDVHAYVRAAYVDELAGNIKKCSNLEDLLNAIDKTEQWLERITAIKN